MALTLTADERAMAAGELGAGAALSGEYPLCTIGSSPSRPSGIGGATVRELFDPTVKFFALKIDNRDAFSGTPETSFKSVEIAIYRTTKFSISIGATHLFSVLKRVSKCAADVAKTYYINLQRRHKIWTYNHRLPQIFFRPTGHIEYLFHEEHTYRQFFKRLGLIRFSRPKVSLKAVDPTDQWSKQSQCLLQTLRFSPLSDISLALVRSGDLSMRRSDNCISTPSGGHCGENGANERLPLVENVARTLGTATLIWQVAVQADHVVEKGTGYRDTKDEAETNHKVELSPLHRRVSFCECAP